MTDTVKLEPCPFCGDDAQVREQGRSWYVFCDCPAGPTCHALTESGAWVIWNTRAATRPAPKDSGLAEALQKLINAANNVNAYALQDYQVPNQAALLLARAELEARNALSAIPAPDRDAVRADKFLASLQGFMEYQPSDNDQAETVQECPHSAAAWRRLFLEACDLWTWMSGSSDFSPGGPAHEGWLKTQESRQRILGGMKVAREMTGRPPMQKNTPGETCEACGAPEVEANMPETVYACGSKDFDKRPGTFKQSDTCKQSTPSHPSAGRDEVREAELEIIAAAEYWLKNVKEYSSFDLLRLDNAVQAYKALATPQGKESAR